MAASARLDYQGRRITPQGASQTFGETSMALFVLSAVGSDRPGLTRALAAAILSAGGNWLESHLSRLGGLYVGSVLVELAAEGVDELRAAVSGVDAQGLEVRIAPAIEGAGVEGEVFEFGVVGQDRPGIVREVTAVLSGLEANIETFRTWISAEAHSGVPLFHIEARLRLPPGLPAFEVQAALEGISAEIMVDISLTPAG
jgi:glycine cleavage system regulatory protein